jgi:hypothetical protein
MTSKTWVRPLNAALAVLLMGLLAALPACKTDDPAADGGGAEAGATAATDEKDVPAQIDVSKLPFKEKAAVFVLPAPSEIALLLQEADKDGTVVAAVGTKMPVYDGLPTWTTALALGLATGDLLITIPSAPDDTIVARLDNVAAGMKALGATQEQIDDLTQLRGRVADGSINREQLVRELDVLRTDLLTEGQQQYGDREIALIAVGGWARAVNLFATLAKDAGGEIPKGADVLKLRIVVDTLIEQVGGDDDVKPVVQALNKILPVASSVGRADAPPTAEDLAVLEAATAEILALVPVK